MSRGSKRDKARLLEASLDARRRFERERRLARFRATRPQDWGTSSELPPVKREPARAEVKAETKK